MNARRYIFKKAYLSLKHSSRYPKFERMFCDFHIVTPVPGREAVLLYLQEVQRGGKNTHRRLRRSFATAATSEIKHTHQIQLKINC